MASRRVLWVLEGKPKSEPDSAWVPLLGKECACVSEARMRKIAKIADIHSSIWEHRATAYVPREEPKR